jgi:uncharacterized protein (TIGR01777 family)
MGESGMKIFITGGTGFIGRALTGRLLKEGYEVGVLTRKKPEQGRLIEGLSFIEGNPAERGEWQKCLNDYDAVINLAGAGIFRRWTRNNKELIRDSRIFTTKNLVEAMTDSGNRERLLISTSAVGYYGYHGDEELTEQSPPGRGFLAELSGEWEKTATNAERSGCSVVICRLGVVLGKEGGALKKMLTPYRYYMGSPLGTGRQYFSWIHLKDLVEIYAFLIKKGGVRGPVNCTAPEPVRNSDLARNLGRVLYKPVFMPPVPGFVIRLVMGEFADTILKGQRVLPKRLQEMGFKFEFPSIDRALEDILRD